MYELGLLRVSLVLNIESIRKFTNSRQNIQNKKSQMPTSIHSHACSMTVRLAWHPGQQLARDLPNPVAN